MIRFNIACLLAGSIAAIVSAFQKASSFKVCLLRITPHKLYLTVESDALEDDSRIWIEVIQVRHVCVCVCVCFAFAPSSNSTQHNSTQLNAGFFVCFLIRARGNSCCAVAAGQLV